MRRILFKLLLPLMAIVFATTANLFGLSNPSAASLPNPEELQSRIEAFYKAERDLDLKSYYNLLDSSIRSQLTYEQFTSQPTFQYTLISWKPLLIEKSQPSTPLNLLTAKVAMDVTVQYPGESPKRVADQTDYWVYRDGHWFWAWRGWPAD